MFYFHKYVNFLVFWQIFFFSGYFFFSVTLILWIDMRVIYLIWQWTIFSMFHLNIMPMWNTFEFSAIFFLFFSFNEFPQYSFGFVSVFFSSATNWISQAHFVNEFILLPEWAAYTINFIPRMRSFFLTNSKTCTVHSVIFIFLSFLFATLQFTFIELIYLIFFLLFVVNGFSIHYFFSSFFLLCVLVRNRKSEAIH